MKYFLLVFGMVVCTNSFGQKLSALDGLGLFKIGRLTTSGLKDSMAMNPLELTNISWRTFESSVKVIRSQTELTPAALYEILESPQNAASELTIVEPTDYVKGYRHFFLTRIDIGPVRVTNIHLSFLNDTLMRISCDYSSELIEAMSVKYGPGRTQTRSKPIRCIYQNTGNKIEKEEIRTETTWTNRSIEATSLQYLYFSSNCDEQFTRSVAIVEKRTYARWKILKKAKQADVDTKVEETLREKYRGF